MLIILYAKPCLKCDKIMLNALGMLDRSCLCCMKTLHQIREGVGQRIPMSEGSPPLSLGPDDPPEDEELSLHSELVMQPLPQQLTP